MAFMHVQAPLVICSLASRHGEREREEMLEMQQINKIVLKYLFQKQDAPFQMLVIVQQTHDFMAL